MNGLYRIWSYVRHVLTAWNTTGEGIHSPYLFYLVRFLMRDENAYYCFADIERRRETLKADRRELDVLDYGSAGSPEGKTIRRSVGIIAREQLERAHVGQLLFRLVAFMSHDQKRPLRIVELGTSLGITTAYLAAPDSRNKITTLEGSQAVAKVACEQWEQLGLKNIECVIGNIDETLYEAVREGVDLAYVDANHTYEATMRYVNYLLSHLEEKGIVVLDDIYYSPDMTRAWERLKNDERVTTSMDLYHVGLLFIDKHYLKRHYRVRVEG